MVTFREAVARAARNVSCAVMAANADLFQTVIADNSIIPGYNPWRGAYNLFCDRPPPPTGVPPFSGGQCDVPYRVFYRQFLEAADGSETFLDFSGEYPALLSGPIVGVRREGAPNNSPNQLDRALFYIVYDGGANEVQVFDASVWQSNARVDILNVIRADGLSDNCGNPIPPPPPPPDPEDLTRREPVTYDDPDGNPITYDVDFFVGLAYIDADLNVNIPLNIRVDLDVPINLRAEFNLNTGDFNLNVGDPSAPGSPNDGGGGSGGQPGGYDTDSPPPPPTSAPPEYTPPDYDEDTIETETIIRGVIVKVTQLPEQHSVVFTDDIPDIYYPRLGNVSFYVRISNTFAWTEFIPVTSLQQLIECPWEGGAVAVRAHPNPGGIFSLSPVYRRGEKGYTYNLS